MIFNSMLKNLYDRQKGFTINPEELSRKSVLEKERAEIHKGVNDYKVLCEKAAEMSNSKKIGAKLENGWTVKDNNNDKDSNFKGVLYEKDGQYAFAFAGTDKMSPKDWGANLKMGITGNSVQIRNAKDFVTEMIPKYGLNSDNRYR